MEVSSHGLAQDRVRGVEFNARIFTNLTEDHLDFHRSMDEYFHTKALLFEDDDHAAASATSVINVDDAWGRRLILSGGIRADTMTYGFSPEARVRAEQVQGDGGGSWFTLCSPWGDAEVRLSLPGRFNVSNALAAVAAAGAVGVELDAMAQSLRELDSVPGRLEPVANDLGVSIFVDYAHTEDALTHVLRSVRGFLDGRLIVVFGCGGDRHAGKRPDMGATAARLADAVIITSDNPRSEDPMAIIAEIAEGCPDATHVEQVENRREAISRALQSARPGDAVVVAGKGHETTQQIGHTVHPFDDREVIQNLLKEMES
jgi:UDP-N-acetylmuramoyl-L-alanyl-D-glutamate--2,6-diaminopimelate ligase